jgi:CSLREA domain-containing protein
MSHLRRLLHLALLVSLVLAWFAVAQRPPSARAAGTFTVTTTQDLTSSNPTCAPPCSLRQAIEAANAAGPGSVVAFNIPNDDPGYDDSDPNARTWTISPTLALPYIITDSITIDGNSQARSRGGNPNIFGPEIIINGTNVTNAGGITLISNNNTIIGLGIINFRGGNPTGTAIEVRGNNNIIQGNFIGLNKYGTGALGNTGPGIWVRGNNNLIGGDSSASTTQFNVISGNEHDGILLEGDDNQIRGNYIGTDRNGLNAVPNLEYGINVRIQADRNIIGTDAASSEAVFRNIISGNGKYGIIIRDSRDNKVYGNWIGLDDTGDARIPNGQGGVQIAGIGLATTGNIIGGTSTAARNLIAGNAGPGINISGRFATGNVVANNNIGLGLSNTVPAGSGTNQTVGILIDQGASGNTIGGSGATARNVISGNGGDGIRIVGDISNNARSDNNIISGNYIGTTVIGSGSIPNAGAGIAIDTNVRFTRIGGTTMAASNVIAHNGGDGILITGAQVLTNTLLKNTIAFNTGNGVRINGARSTLISGVDVAGANQIANNSANGILVTGGISTTIQFNALVDNGQNGVRVDGGASLTNIYTNTILSNAQNGVLVQGNNTRQARIIDNKLSDNGLKGIELDPETSWPSGVAANPNHDIDPPFNLRLNQAGRLTGRVRADTTNAATRAASCFACTIQIFTTDPTLLDGEGRDKVNVPVTISSNGYFTATLGSIPRQLALTATDGEGNTSEFAVFDTSFGIAIGPPRASSAVPGQVITYTHRITNTGSVDFTDLRLSGASKLGWPFTLAPTGDLALPAGQSRPVTLTLTLPSGADPRVRAGLVETTAVTVTSTRFPTVTAGLVDTTTVLPKVLLAVSPLTLSGFGTPGATTRYAHTLTNNGNISTTVTLTASTNLGPTWLTSVTPISMTIQPGQAVGVTVNVAVPQSAQKDTVAITTLRITVPGDPTQNRLVTDTTTVELVPRATLTPDRTGDAGAGEKIQFLHTVENKSNGSATFRLTAVSSLGSTIRFIRTDGGTFGPDNSFTLGAAPGSNQLNFIAEVTVDRRAFRGDTDTVTISLLDTQGRVVATAQDRINVTRGAIVPRLYLPIVRR